MEIKNNSRFKELDALRGIAAISVALFHYTFGYDSGEGILSPDKFYFKYGNLGVQLFFLISGFVIFMTLEKTKKPADFIVSRFSRLYPAYWAGILVTIAFTALLAAPQYTGIYSLKQALVNFTMFEYWLKVDYIDLSYWTLAVELTFYAIMWCFFTVDKLKHIWYVCLCWLLLAVLSSMFDLPFNYYLSRFLILKHAPLFIGGIGFYLAKKEQKNGYNHLLIVLSLLAEYVINYEMKSNYMIFMVITVFYMTFYLFVYEKLNFLTNKTLMFWGSISYSFYLIHQNVGCSMIYQLKKVYDNQLFYVPVTIFCVMLIAYCITTFIEKPSMNWIRKKYKEIQKKQVPIN